MENNDSIHENDVEEDNTLMYIYEWVDSVPLSRQKRTSHETSTMGFSLRK